jgi:hypothetical protein
MQKLFARIPMSPYTSADLKCSKPRDENRGCLATTEPCKETKLKCDAGQRQKLASWNPSPPLGLPPRIRHSSLPKLVALLPMQRGNGFNCMNRGFARQLRRSSVSSLAGDEFRYTSADPVGPVILHLQGTTLNFPNRSKLLKMKPFCNPYRVGLHDAVRAFHPICSDLYWNADTSSISCDDIALQEESRPSQLLFPLLFPGNPVNR